MTVGENIRKFRKERNLTQKQLGQKCGIDEANIRKYELGNANPKFETVAKIAKALDTTPLILFYGLDIEAQLEQEQKESSYLIEPDEIEHELLDVFWELNEKGAAIALERLKELTEIPRYVEDKE